MRILALNPPFFDRFSREARSPAVAKSGTFYFPMWLAYATGYLESNGHEVELLDAVASRMTIDAVVRRANDFGCRMAIIDTSTPSIYSDIAAAASLKRALPALATVLVGPHVSALPEQTLRDAHGAVDAVAYGEYDATVLEMARNLSLGHGTPQALAAVQGVAFRKADGSIQRNPPRELLPNLDCFPYVSSVYKKHLNVEDYFYGHSRYPLVALVTGRGCPFRCTYCVLPQTMHGHAYRKRSICNVVAEFQYIIHDMPQVREIMLEDDTLTNDKDRCRELCYSLIEGFAASVPWSANSRADVDYETLCLMKRAGCRLLCVGFESGEQKILNNIKKGTTIPNIRRFMQNAKKAGILVHGCFMVGNRGETRETLKTTLSFAKQLNPDTAQFFPIMVYPGTSDYEYYDSKGWIGTKDFSKWISTEGLHSSVVTNPDLGNDELVAFCDFARQSYYFRPSYLALKAAQIVRSPSEAPRIFRGFAQLSRYLIRSPSGARGKTKNTAELAHAQK